MSIRTEQTKSILWKLARKLGMSPSDDPSVNNLTDDQARPLLSYIHEGAKMAWDSWDWDAVCPIEQRFYSGPYVQGINLTAGVLPTTNPSAVNLPYDQTANPTGSIIYDPTTLIYWMALQNGDPGSPSVVPSAWQQVTLVGQVNIFADPYLLDAPLLGPPFPPPPPAIPPSSGLVVLPSVVPFIQFGKGEVDTVLGVFATDPRNQPYPIGITYSISQRGIELLNTDLTNVWVHYRKPFPGIGSEPWVQSTYNLNDITYYNGDSWFSVVNNNTSVPGADSNWTQFRIQYDWVAGVLAYAYAMALEEDGQDQKAQTQYQKSSQLFVQAYDKETSQQGQTSFYNVIVR